MVLLVTRYVLLKREKREAKKKKERKETQTSTFRRIQFQKRETNIKAQFQIQNTICGEEAR